MDNVASSEDPLSCLSTDFVEELFRQYSENPSTVPPEWRSYFASLNGHVAPRAIAASPASPPRLAGRQAPPATNTQSSLGQEKVDRLVWAFRYWGHLAADIDPLGLRGVGESFWADLHPTYQLRELTIAHHGLSDADLDEVFTSTLHGRDEQTLQEIIDDLREIYCGSIGYEFMHVQDLNVRDWFLQRVELEEKPAVWDVEQRRRVLKQLIRADVFEQFIRKKFPGAKVFSIDGTESLVPLLDWMLERATQQSIDEVVLGMAHRGRLNVLTNVFSKLPCDLFRSFEDRLPQGPKGHGDVRYHLGDDVTWRSPSGRSLHLSMCFNPSHLEYVNSVAMGRVRAMQEAAHPKKAIAVLLHGDAAFAGEGIVYEALNLGRLSAYDTGGVVHVIINNQIGFTTTPEEARSTTYATDVARAVQIPVLHVNGEDLQAVLRAVDLAMDFRLQFGRDIVIDLMGFRRWGHNETDEPSFTQPRLYNAIEKHLRLREGAVEQAIAAGAVTKEEVEKFEQGTLEFLRSEYDRSTDENAAASLRRLLDDDPPPAKGATVGGLEEADESDTAIELPQLQSMLQRLAECPRDFHVHPKLRRSQDDRRKMAALEETLDWSTGEALAIASLAIEGHPVRLVGQDTQRGTFSQRHAVLHDVVDGRTHNIFSQLQTGQARVDLINSPLSESAAMGFEYGYCLDAPTALVAWEAQFGDFVNVAQVIIDQFLTSAEDKWDQYNGLVLLLPHGFEGQGPEHSSARLERFLMLAAEDNIQIVQPSTPAQYFHVLRRQMKRRWRKPLVVFTPKSLLRHRQARSPLEDLAKGGFQRVIGDPLLPTASKVLMCSGKVYYELTAFREDQKRDDVAIVRIEQFYPLSDDHLRDVLKVCAPDTPVTWVQEEPENMGASRFWKARFGHNLWDRHPFNVVARAESASPATGSKAIHKQEQHQLLSDAFGEAPPPKDVALTSREITA
jgi:2-oxoglutarate dehydrogenase E1 component